APAPLLLQPGGKSHSEYNVTNKVTNKVTNNVTNNVTNKVTTRNPTITSSAVVNDSLRPQNVDISDLTAPTAQLPAVATSPLTVTISDVSRPTVSAAAPAVQTDE